MQQEVVGNDFRQIRTTDRCCDSDSAEPRSRGVAHPHNDIRAIMETIFGAGWVAATIFFIVLGLFQLMCVGIFIKSHNPYLLALGVLGNLISILICFISTSGVTIFGVPPQPFIPFGVLIKVLEAVFVLATVYVMKVMRS